MQQPAIPTQYKGVNFRSRLEATWAAFFDLRDWVWEYEPLDLNGWIPDFMLLGCGDYRAKYPVLVEVKPLSLESQSPPDEVLAKLSKALRDQPYRALLLGLGPWHKRCSECKTGVCFGLEYYSPDELPGASAEWFGDTLNLTENFGYGDCNMAWDDRISELDNKQTLYEMTDSDAYEVAHAQWKRARNTTQWCPVQPRHLARPSLARPRLVRPR